MSDLCDYCGEPYLVDLLEVWPEERAWMFDTCCEGAHEELCYALEIGEGDVRQWVRDLFADYGIQIRRAYASETEPGSLRLDFGLELGPVTRDEAKAFVLTHHRHNKPPCGWRWGHGLFNGDDLIGVAMVGRPVARKIDHTTIVEVNRNCINPEIDHALVEHAASKLYGAAAREAKRRGFAKIITYTLVTESGTSLKAAGWTWVDSSGNPVTDVRRATTKGGSWDRKSRRRADSAPTCAKIRWGKQLRAA